MRAVTAAAGRKICIGSCAEDEGERRQAEQNYEES
jgi:hypothetical protein